MKPVDFTIYWKETPVVQVCYDAMKQPQFTVLDHSHLPVLLFGMDGKAVPTAARLDKFFADRCFPSTRQNAKELLAIAGLTLYQPKLICRKTHGIVAHDHYWIRYADDPSDLSHASLMQEMSKAVKTPSATTIKRNRTKQGRRIAHVYPAVLSVKIHCFFFFLC